MLPLALILGMPQGSRGGHLGPRVSRLQAELPKRGGGMGWPQPRSEFSRVGSGCAALLGRAPLGAGAGAAPSPRRGWSRPLGSAPSSSPLCRAGPSPSSRFRWQELEPCPAVPVQLPQDSALSGPARPSPARSGDVRVSPGGAGCREPEGKVAGASRPRGGEAAGRRGRSRWRGVLRGAGVAAWRVEALGSGGDPSGG